MARELLTLEPTTADRGRGPWQVSTDDGATWWNVTRDAGRARIVAAGLPLDRVELVEQGGTVKAGGLLVRRRPTPAEAWVRERQPELFA